MDRVRWLTILGYVCAALLLFFVFLYLALPYDAVGRWLLRRAEATAGVRIQALSVERLYPLGLRWHGVTLGAPDGRTKWADFSSVSAEPVLASLLSRRKVVRIRAELAEGVIEGQVGIGRPQSSDAPLYRIDLTRIEGFDLANVQPFLPGVKGLSGRLSGNLAYEWSADQPLYGTGTLFLNVERMVLGGEVMQRWQVPLERVEFEQVTCGLSLTQGRADISTCTALGPLGQLGLSGTAQVQQPLMRSTLALRAQISWQGITPVGGPPLTAVVSGPLGSPQLRLENVQLVFPGARAPGGLTPQGEPLPSAPSSGTVAPLIGPGGTDPMQFTPEP